MKRASTMNPLKRWEASVAQIDQDIADRILVEKGRQLKASYAINFEEKGIAAFKAWRDSGWSDAAYLDVKEWAHNRPDKYIPIPNLMKLVKELSPEAIRIRKKRGECTWMLEHQAVCRCNGSNLACRRR